MASPSPRSMKSKCCKGGAVTTGRKLSLGRWPIFRLTYLVHVQACPAFRRALNVEGSVAGRCGPAIGGIARSPALLAGLRPVCDKVPRVRSGPELPQGFLFL